MKFLHKNLTPFFWGPKATSRRGRQVEMAICVRGAFRLRPGEPVTPIEDKMEQGFMSGDTWAEADVERAGPLTHTSDFADWKPFADLLLKGTAYPPKGADVACTVTFGVGEWRKSLRVVGPRTWKPGLLFGGAASDPEPFTHMPLTWENAYGGPGYPQNPVGKGFTGQELPTVEDPAAPVSKVGAKGVAPGAFLPVSPTWAPRAAKMNAGDYGAKWQSTRAPFVAEDFDWTFWNAAPADQQLPKYLRGDEPLLFENLHPQASRWEAKLPGLRLRAFVRGGDDVIRDILLPLDTLTADLDAGRLYLVWRGHVPVQQVDLTDVKSVLIASEPLAEPPKPREHYLPILAAFEDDPIGIKEQLPPGFLQVAAAIEAFEKAEVAGAPLPDLKQVAATLPAGCPIPPWFLAAIAGEKDPIGVKAMLPASMFSDDPLGLRERLPQMAGVDPHKLTGAFGGPQKSPQEIAATLDNLAKDLPPELGGQFKQAADQMRASMVQAQAAAAQDPHAAQALAARLASPPPPAPPMEPPGVQMAQAGPRTEAMLLAAGLAPEHMAKAAPKLEALKSLPSLDQRVAASLAHLDQVQLPAPPQVPDVETQLAAKKAELASQEAALRAQGVSHPLLGLFALGQRVIDKMPRPADVAPDLSLIPQVIGQAKDQLLAQGISLAALGPLVRLQGRVETLVAQCPQPRPKPPQVDLAYQDLQQADLRGRDLRGKSLARAKLGRADLTGAQLQEADLSQADLSGADLSDADLSGARLCKAKLAQARLAGANLRGADLSGADLSEADLSGARLTEARLEGAILQDARAVEADLTRANLADTQLPGADLTRARLVEASLEQAKGEKLKLEGADLTRANLRFAALAKADLRGAVLVEADLSLAQLQKARGDGADLSRVRFDMGQLTGSRLQRAKLTGARASMGALSKCDLTGADLREVQLEKVDFAEAVLDQADFTRATLRGCMLRDVTATAARFDHADLDGSSATGKCAFLECRFLLTRGHRAVFFGADLSRSDFSHALLREAFFQEARGTDVNFFAADLSQAVFRKADLRRTRFVRANLRGAVLNEARLIDMQFTGANLYDAVFMEAQLAGCDWLEADLARARFDRAVGAPS